MSLARTCGALAASCLLIAACAAPQERPPTRGTVIVNAQIADGTGAALRTANVRVVGDRIERVGAFEPQSNDTVIEARGLVLAPGFIDMHNHSDEALEKQPLADSQIAQGITIIVLGLDGYSPYPVGPWLEGRRRNPAALNLTLTVGHASIREHVMQKDFRRAATAAEVERMVQLVDEAMRQGAVGISSGVEYDVASYATTDELVAVARASAQHGGFYMTHVRDEADKSFAALEEEIAIGERARSPVQHSHIKLGTVNVWNKAQEFIRVIEAARSRGLDFLADCYPYDAWNSTIKVLVPNKQYEDPASVERALADVGGGSRVTITEFPPNRSYEMRTLEQLAQAAGISQVEMFIRVIREGNAGGADAIVIGQSMTDEDIKAFYQQPWVMVASDGWIGATHPRGAGTFPRVLGRFVRERGWLTLPEAIRKMTALPAQRLGWKDRGVLREGAFADLVLFDPETVLDQATFAQPTVLPRGIEKVFVNGEMVWSEGKATGARPGRVLSR
ncbi:MAG TPA: D-aminoacylase [Steroidobacteraceae bacterium]|nr:D-aminoacylase [Steroidobacteraceae bacterium]